MKIGVAVLMSFLGLSGLAQAQSVWLEDLTATEIQAAVAAGKTTAIYYAGAIHQAGPAVAVGRHLFVARYVAQRAAEELGNALVLPVNMYAPANAGGDPAKKEGHLRSAGTLSITDTTFINMVREAVTSAIVSTGFKTVILIGDHGAEEDPLKKAADTLDGEWKSKGTRVYHIPVYEETDDVLVPEYLTKLKVPDKQQQSADDVGEVMPVDRDHKWVRQDKIPAEYRDIVTLEVGETLLQFKVDSAVRHIRSLTTSNK
jgi:creatinine amidohydrolase